MSDKDFCPIGNACMWHLGWRVKLSELQALLCLPSSRQAWSSSILAPVWFSAQSPQWFPPHPPALPTTGKNLSFWKSRIWPYRLFTITFMPGKMVLFFLPLCLLSLSSSPKPDSWGAISYRYYFHGPFLGSFQPAGVLCPDWLPCSSSGWCELLT